MVSSITNSASNNIEDLITQMFKKLNAADKDGIQGLSKNELSSINTGDDAGGAAFLKSLETQFNRLDTNSDGQLSSQEISNAIPPKEPMGPPPGMSIESNDKDSDDANKILSTTASTTSGTSSTSSNSMEDMLEKLMTSFMDSFIKKFNQETSTSSASSSTTSNPVSSLVSAADSDKSGVLSLNELSSLDTGNNKAQSGLVNDLINNFKNYDTNSDGTLSAKELSAAIPDNNALAGNFNESGATSLGSSLGSASASFLQKLLSNYGSDFSGLKSSLSIVG